MDRVVFKEVPVPMEIPIIKTIEKEVRVCLFIYGCVFVIRIQPFCCV